LYVLHPSVFLPTSTISFRRLSHNDIELKEIGIQIPYSEFTRRKKILEAKQEERTCKVSKP